MLYWIPALAVALMTPWYGRLYLHMLQLEGYKPVGLIHSFKRNALRALPMPVGIGAAAWLLGMLWPWAPLIALVAGLGAWGALVYRAPAKKPLVWTPRAKRLCACMALLVLGAAMLHAAAAVLLLPVLMLLAAALMWPIEQAINRWYFDDAKKRLAARPELIKIGITGSYGKTSAKFIVTAILSEKYRVLTTPSSFNTPMGLTKVIRGDLKDEHEVLVAEMGARHRGDIAELCELVKPGIGIITSIGYQHIETFGNIETIAATKNELIEALPSDGTAVLAADDGGWCDRLYGRKKPQKSLRAGISAGLDGLPLDVTARDLEVGAFGSRFVFADAEGEIVCNTKLLGRHNIGNILICGAAARALGLSLEEIARGIEKLEPVEHRLQLLPSAAGLIVIDDAFNANPAGTRAALEVLARFEKKKIIITPGLVELGEREEAENHAFGRAMSGVCTDVILIGDKRAQSMRLGLLETGFNMDRVHIVASLDQATSLLPGMTSPGDAVLFENDLPDHM